MMNVLELSSPEVEDTPEHVRDSPQASLSSLDPNEAILCLRLSAANARRRDQLKYWGGHPFRENQEPVELESAGTFSRGDGQSLGPASEKPSYKSNPTIRTFSTVARSAIFENEGVAGASRTTYADSTIGDAKSVKRLPAVPHISKTAASFDCPFCHMSLDSATMQDRHSWK